MKACETQRLGEDSFANIVVGLTLGLADIDYMAHGSHNVVGLVEGARAERIDREMDPVPIGQSERAGDEIIIVQIEDPFGAVFERQLFLAGCPDRAETRAPALTAR